jgi:hypothetical protein
MYYIFNGMDLILKTKDYLVLRNIQETVAKTIVMLKIQVFSIIPKSCVGDFLNSEALFYWDHFYLSQSIHIKDYDLPIKLIFHSIVLKKEYFKPVLTDAKLLI